MPTFSINNYITIGLGAVIFFLALWVFTLKSDIAVLEANKETAQERINRMNIQIDSFVGSIGRQNDAIDRMSINTQKAIETFNSASPKIIEKYSTIKVKDSSCEAELEAIKQTQRIFNGEIK